MPQRQVKIGDRLFSVPENATMDQIQEYAASQGVTAGADFSNVQGGSSTATTTPGQAFLQGLQKQIGGEGGELADLLTGVGKRAGEFVQGGGQWLESLTGQPVSPPRTTSTGRDVFAANNPAQEAGRFAGGVGIGTALSAAGGPSLAMGVAGGGLGSALLDPDNAKVAGGIGMAAPIVSAAAEGLVPWIKKLAERGVTKAINPRTNAEKDALARVIEPITESQPFAMTRGGLLEVFTKRADDAANAIDEAIDAVGSGSRAVDVKLVASKIDPAIDALKDPNTGKIVTQEAQEMAARLGRIKAEIKAIGTINGKDVGTTLQSLRQLKQQFASAVKTGQAQNFFRILPFGSRAAAANEGFHAAQEGMIDVGGKPLEEANRAFHQAATARDIIANNEARNTGNSGLARLAGIGMYATGQTAAAAKVVAAKHFLDSTAFRLAKANAQTMFRQAIERGDVPAITALMGQMTREAVRQGFKDGSTQ